MDNLSQHSKSDLPNTPRVTDKIIQYIQKFGQERDLQKFMRLYSPVSSQDSQKTRCDDCVSSLDSCCKRTKSSAIISTTSSCEALAMMPLNVYGVANSKSLPNIVVQGRTTSGKEYFSSNDVVVDINIEAEGEKEKILSISTENLKTPKKTFKHTKTQTPESIAKTHRRLEWDSLGDVGYKKSMSSSNISTIERSLLREFFKENSIASEPGHSQSSREKQNITNEHEIVQKLKTPVVEHGTPPLACSTLVTKPDSGAKPKMITQSTSSTSLYGKFEKYAQTSLIKPPTFWSQEIQCTMSSSNSILEGTATPSSFEYYSSKSSKSRSSKLSDNLVTTNSQKQFQPLEHPFITSITDLLMKRKVLGEKNQQKHNYNVTELQTKLLATLNANKENQSHSTVDSSTVSAFLLSKQAPELDLGIQLICSLIDAKSINGRQKKQLVRDIIKRITSLEAENKTSNSSTNISSEGITTNSSDCHNQHVYDSVRSNSNNKYKQESMAKPRGTLKVVKSPTKTDQVNKQEKSSTSTADSSDNFNGNLVNKQPKTHISSMSLNFPKSHHFQQYQDKSGCKQFPYKNDVNENSQKENSTKVSTETAATINKGAQSELITMQRNKQVPSNCKLTTDELQTIFLKTSIENKINRCTQTSKTSLTSTSDTTTPNLTTQKFIVSSNNELNKSNTDAEEPTMREWLNPLTQSEIEYEEKKLIEMRKKAAAQQQRLIKKSKHDCGRMQQLNWIENEIKRLECLKHLLLKDETATKSSTSVSSLEQSVHTNLNQNSTQTDKLYDTVHSDKSPVLSRNAEELVQEIEIILEESHENVINLKDNIKRTKDRKKETQTIYEREDSLKKSKTKTKPKFRIVNENIDFHEEQLLNARKAEKNGKQRQQREKIDTPSTNKSDESESLRGLVQQKKRDFMEAYKSKKQHHYEALQQQRKEDFKYLNLQRTSREKSATAKDSEHYSVPHTLSRKYTIPSTPSKVEANIKTYCPLPGHVCSTTSVGQQQSTKIDSHQVINTSSANTNHTTTNSSSSMFCISSDISVPMGSEKTSSTPTTTHQYDDVAAAANVAGVAVQTSDSIMRSKPIYGPTYPLTFAASTFSTTACIQVKPKGIAYVIEFDDNKHAISNPTSDIDTNSNDMLKKSNTRSNHSITAEVTNKLRPLKPSEPQLTLQEYLEKRKPKFLQHSKERKVILNQLQSMRQERDRQLREIIDNTSFNSLERRLQYLPPPPIQKTRILKTKEMKALTNKRFVSLPEVLAKQEREIEEKKRRSNRILRDVFNKRLQKRVRSGKLSLNHSKTVI